MSENENTVEEAAQAELVFNGSIPEGETAETCLEVSAKATIDAANGVYKQAVGYFAFGANLEDAVKRFGEEVVFTNFRAQAKIKLQAIMRSYVKDSKDIEQLLSTWKPGVQMERTPVAPEVQAENAFDKMSREEQEVLLQKLMQKMAG